jgi:hypothetical protein
MENFTMLRSRGAFLIAVAVLSIGAGCAKKKVAAVTPAKPEPVATTKQEAPPAAQPRQETTARPAAPTPAARSTVPDASTRARIDQLLARIEDAYFDYDKHTLRADAIEALRKDSTELRDILKDYPDYKLTIEGHSGAGEMYDLYEDPHEMHNIFGEPSYTAVEKQLKQYIASRPQDELRPELPQVGMA